MSINLHCSVCKSSSSIRSKVCKRCGHRFGQGNKYRVVVKSHDGKRVSKVVDSISVARKLESKLKSQAVEKKLLGLSQVPVIDDVWEKYLAWAKGNKKSWDKDFQRWEMHVKPGLAGLRMDSIAPFDIQKLVDQMKSKQDYAPATIKQVIVLVKRVYNWAGEMELYQGDNPVDKVKPPKVSNQITECLSKDEISRLLATLDQWQNKRVALLVKFALYTGLRKGEIFDLAWENVDMQNRLIVLKQTKGGKIETLPISQEAMELIEQAKTLRPSSDCPYVFPNRNGQKRTNIGNIWTRIKKSAKISSEFRFHGLRHTYASYLASSGKVSQYTLQKLLTHKSPQMTQRYAHLFDETLRNGAELFSELI